jgi:PhnB protein
MHASLTIGDSIVMATDGHCTGNANFSGISLTMSVSSDAEAEKMYASLGAGGKVTMPMGKTFFASRFGMLTDRFGVPWMIIVQH